MFASVGAEGGAHLSKLSTGLLLARLIGHTYPVSGVAFTADGRSLYTAGADGQMIGWDIADLKGLGDQPRAPTAGTLNANGPLAGMAVSHSNTIATEYADDSIRFRSADPLTGPSQRVHLPKGLLLDADFSPDGRLLATAGASAPKQPRGIAAAPSTWSMSQPTPSHYWPPGYPPP